MQLPSKAHRVSIHNQIFNTTYYVVSEWIPGKTGGWKSAGRYGYKVGMRGKGNALGLTYQEAVELAAKRNLEEGWEPGQQVLSRKNKPAFELHLCPLPS